MVIYIELVIVVFDSTYSSVYEWNVILHTVRQCAGNYEVVFFVYDDGYAVFVVDHISVDMQLSVADLDILGAVFNQRPQVVFDSVLN